MLVSMNEPATKNPSSSNPQPAPSAGEDLYRTLEARRRGLLIELGEIEKILIEQGRLRDRTKQPRAKERT